MCTSNIGEDNVERLGRDASSILDRCPKYVSLVPMSGIANHVTQRVVGVFAYAAIKLAHSRNQTAKIGQFSCDPSKPLETLSILQCTAAQWKAQEAEAQNKTSTGAKEPGWVLGALAVLVASIASRLACQTWCQGPQLQFGRLGWDLLLPPGQPETRLIRHQEG